MHVLILANLKKLDMLNLNILIKDLISEFKIIYNLEQKLPSLRARYEE